MNISIRQFEVLVTVADTLSFTKAAHILGVSQPSISETVRRVENELGFSVFERTTRQLRLSHKGHRVVVSAREAVKTLRFAIESMGIEGNQADRILTIAALPSVVCTLLPRLLESFHQQIPNVRIDVLDANQSKATRMVLEGIADLAIISTPKQSTVFHYEPVTTDRMLLICHQDDPLARKDVIAWQELDGRRFINLESTSSVRRHCDAALLQTHIRIEPVYEVQQIPSAVALVAAGLGVTTLPEFTLPMFNFPMVRAIPLQNPLLTREIGVLQRRDRRQMAIPGQFIKHLHAIIDPPRAF